MQNVHDVHGYVQYTSQNMHRNAYNPQSFLLYASAITQQIQAYKASTIGMRNILYCRTVDGRKKITLENTYVYQFVIWIIWKGVETFYQCNEY